MSLGFTFPHLETAIKSLANTIRKQDFLTYFKKFTLVSVENTTVTIGVVSGFHRDNLIKKFHSDISSSIKEVNPDITAVVIIVDESIENLDAKSVIDCKMLLKETEKTTKKNQTE